MRSLTDPNTLTGAALVALMLMFLWLCDHEGKKQAQAKPAHTATEVLK